MNNLIKFAVVGYCLLRRKIVSSLRIISLKREVQHNSCISMIRGADHV